MGKIIERALDIESGDTVFVMLRKVIEKVFLELQEDVLGRQLRSKAVHGRWEEVLIFYVRRKAIVNHAFKQFPDA